jgi:hypothetical protein
MLSPSFVLVWVYLSQSILNASAQVVILAYLTIPVSVEAVYDDSVYFQGIFIEIDNDVKCGHGIPP